MQGHCDIGIEYWEDQWVQVQRPRAKGQLSTEAQSKRAIKYRGPGQKGN